MCILSFMSKALSQDDVKKVCTMYQNGDTPTEIAKCFGIHANSVYNVLTREKIPTRTESRKKQLSNVILNQMKDMYAQGLSFASIGERVGLGATTVHKHLTRAGVKARPQSYQVGDQHVGWRGGRVTNAHGYTMVRVGKEYVLEHRLVMAEILGRPLTEYETVHHKDGNRQNNHPDNLQLRQGRHGKGGAFQCGDCGSHNIIATALAEKN